MARASQDVLQDGPPAKENLGVGRLEEKSPRGRSWHSSLFLLNAQGKLPPAPPSATTYMCPWSIVPTTFVAFCKSFGCQQGIPTSDSFTPLCPHAKEPLVSPCHGLMERCLQPSHGGIPGSHAHKGSFLPLPQHGRTWPKHSVSFCAHWPRSSLARCQLPGRSVSPPELRRQQQPSPKHWRFVRGGGAEWWVCAAGNAAGGEGG